MANTHNAPVLAKVSIGFAMGTAGTDTAIKTADVALMDHDLRKLPHFDLRFYTIFGGAFWSISAGGFRAL